MRHNIEKALKEELRTLALTLRDRLNLTQSKMAEKLIMTDRSYSDIETGENMCGTLTTILLLAELDDPKTYLQELKGKIDALLEEEKAKETDIQLV
ncbi:MAG: helix-turn-helix domain-containing protein [Clostridia bacterium]|nr:helix-turn-helix domain-containing protein [Clostridia bacterium]